MDWPSLKMLELGMKSWSSSTSLRCKLSSPLERPLIGSEDKRHGLKELAALDLVIEGQKKGISVSEP
jgi:hypothetical protein